MSLDAADAVRDHVVLWSQAVPNRVDLSQLDDAERQRVRAAATPTTVRQRAAGFTLVRRALAEVLGADARVVALDRTCSRCGSLHGPPRVVADPGLFVSATHVRTQAGRRPAREAGVIVALTRIAPVGLDIVCTDDVQFPGFDAVALHPDDGLPADATSRARVWARKEAVLKALGVGLDTEPSSFPAGSPGVVQGLPNGACVTVADLDLQAPAAQQSLGFDVGPAGQTVAAVALARSAPLVAVWWMPSGHR